MNKLLHGIGVVMVALALGSPAQAADPIRVYAAGSLSNVMPKLIAGAGLSADTAVPVFGPAGMLRHRLESGEHADLFASADLAQPQAIVAAKGGTVVPFARNRMCVLTPERLGLKPDTLLDRMLSADLRVATSTPGADPGGDYAFAVFDRAEALHPGARAALRAKALTLVGGPASIPPEPGHSAAASLFLRNQADMLIYYCSGAATALREMPGLVSFPLPDALEVGPVYGMAVLSTRPEAAQLAAFMVSPAGQAILTQGGFSPVDPER